MIPVSEPELGERERAYLLDCLSSGWISSAGHYIPAFESAWAHYCGARYGVAVSSGTAALHVAVSCLDLKPGDEVILPTFTIISCAQCVVACGGTPVLVDCDPRTWCLDVASIGAKITSRTRAIIAVHIYGHPVDMDPVMKIASQYGLAVIEDAAEAHGAEYLTGHGTPDEHWQKCGSLADIGVFSFYANKLITTGEGGMLLTNSQDTAHRARRIRNLYFPDNREFVHDKLGYNYRITNMQAAIGLAQSETIEDKLSRKRRVADVYLSRLRDLPGLQLPAEEPWAKSSYWMFGILCSRDTHHDRRSLALALHSRGVQTRPFFQGMHRQPALLQRGLFVGESYPACDYLSDYGLYLPSGGGLTDSQLAYVADTVGELLG